MLIYKLKFLENRNTPKKFMLKYFYAKLAKKQKELLKNRLFVRSMAAFLTGGNRFFGLVSQGASSSLSVIRSLCNFTLSWSQSSQKPSRGIAIYSIFLVPHTVLLG